MKKANEKEKEVIEISEDELYAAAVNVRTNGLLAVISEDLEEEARMSLGANGLPCIDAVLGGMVCRMSYFPVGDTDTDRFMLMIRVAVLAGDEEDDRTDALFACESFNVASVFGSAVFIPVDGSVEFRVAIPEMGGMSDPAYYRFVFNMVTAAVNDLKELLEEK